MFEQSLMEQNVSGKRGLSVMISFALQVGLIIIALLFPLLNYYDIPVAELTTFLVAPPPPPPPPPPPAAVVKPKKIIPKEFDAGKLTQPKKIPDKVAIIEEDSAPPPSGIVGVVGGVSGGSAGGQLGGVLGGIVSNVPSVAPPPPPPPVKKEPPPTPKRINVGGAVQKARLLRQVQPQYPPLARQARIQGTVKLTAVIDKDGSIQQLEVINGHPLLIPAAMQAVKQWRYKPTLLNGQAVEVVTQIDVNFTLSG
ncbi:MAG: TonB family protein [Bryobacterales bacterium]|nr:TonB family protein [Bryobacterales bacterium]